MSATRATTRILALVLTVAACGGSRDPAAQPPPAPLDLAGARIMIVPARAGEPRALEAELVFWLTERSPGTEWVRPAEVEDAVASIPARFALDAPRRLIEERGDEIRLADPLYGDLRRLGAVLEADLALVPLGTRIVTDSAGVTVELTAALASIRGGRVLWLHTVRSGPVESVGDGVAGAVEALARTLIRAAG
jgi:hypothetical protein